MSNMVHVAVGECLLTVNDNEFPVSQFGVSYALDALPMASVMPALGRSLDESKTNYSSIADIREGDEASITITVDGEEHTLLEGYVGSLAGTDNSSLLGRTLSVNITVQHVGVDIAGSPSSSFVYAGNVQSLNTLVDVKAKFSQFGSEDGYKDIDSVSSVLGRLLGNETPVEQSDTAGILFQLTKDLTDTFRPTFSADDVLIPYEGAKIANLALSDRVSYVSSIVDMYLAGWGNSNCWSALQQVCQFLFLRLVPFNKGIYIGNPMGFLREPDIVVSSDEYMSMKETTQRGAMEKAEGVYVSLPLRQTNIQGVTSIGATFPPLEGGEVASITQANKYYTSIQLPSWMYSIEGARYGASIAGGGGKKITNKNRAATTPAVPPSDNVADTFLDLGGRAAKAAFASYRARKSEVRLTMPFRVDIMPGTLLKLAVRSEEDLSFIGDTLYGMVHSVMLQGSMLGEGGELSCQVTLTHLRNEKDNKDDNLTFTEHPIYDEQWKPIDINGKELKEDE